jgi:hypothetical protein
VFLNPGKKVGQVPHINKSIIRHKCQEWGCGLLEKIVDGRNAFPKQDVREARFVGEGKSRGLRMDSREWPAIDNHWFFTYIMDPPEKSTVFKFDAPILLEAWETFSLRRGRCDDANM